MIAVPPYLAEIGPLESIGIGMLPRCCLQHDSRVNSAPTKASARSLGPCSLYSFGSSRTMLFQRLFVILFDVINLSRFVNADKVIVAQSDT